MHSAEIGQLCCLRVTVLTRAAACLQENEASLYQIGTERLFSMQHPLFWFSRILWAAGCLGSSGLACAQTTVGEATMVIGMASAVGSDGNQRLLQRGSAIRVGDRIETPDGGHVLLRFVDGGRLSVRPASRLHIESYSQSTDQAHQGAIKFKLDEGVVRSITGAWGEAARERFRLNTPVAAIGVKGTDFIVRSHADTTAATVYTGAITLTPLTGDCGAGVGPCINGSEKLLTADMKGQMLELARSQSTPVLVATNSYITKPPQHLSRPPSAEAPEAVAQAPHVMSTVPPDTTSTKSLANETLGTTVAAYIPPTPAQPEVPTSVVPPPPELAPAPVLPPPPAPPVVELPPATQLTWVRYPWVAQPSSDNFTERFNQALVSGLEKIAGNATYVLYQTPGASPTLSPQNLTDPIVRFQLSSASAHLWRNAFQPVENVSVLGGALTVDFNRNSFSTLLNLNGSGIGSNQVTASGTLLPSGVMNTNASASNVNLLGAVTTDGQQAGYAFERAIGTNLLRGVTLWGR